MISAKRALFGAIMALVLSVVACLPATAGAASAATPGPAWSVSLANTSPTNFTPGDTSGSYSIRIEAINVGSTATDPSKPITITDLLPAGLTFNPSPVAFLEFSAFNEVEEPQPCEAGPPVSCTFPSTTVYPGETIRMTVPVNVEAGAPASVLNEVTITGGGVEAASASLQTTISPNPAPFGIRSFFSSIDNVAGGAETQAGAHPYQLRVGANFNTIPGFLPVENPKNVTVNLPAGVILNPRATPVRCEEAQLEQNPPVCPDASAVGLSHVYIRFPVAPADIHQPIYNMVPPQGRPAELGLNVLGLGITIHLLGKVRSDGDYGLSSETFDAPQYDYMAGVSAELWGDPSDPSHDHKRGSCAADFSGESCPVAPFKVPLLTMPSACSGPLVSSISADSWQDPGDFVTASAQTEDRFGNPASVTGCEKLPYAPSNETAMSTEQAETGSGIDFNVDFPQNGLLEKEALAESATEKAEVTLPEGITINPSVGEGLGFCTPSQNAKETAFTQEGEGCPADSKIGTLLATTPLLEEAIEGSVYLAQQDNPETKEPGAENPFDTDIALYLVLKNPQLGVIVDKPLKVIPDPKTGQLVATLEGIPQLPISHFTFHFKEGSRAALITPPSCGKYTTVAEFYPYSAPSKPKTIESSFEITKGVNGGPCPQGGVPPFHPEFQAGAINNAAGSFSPFNMRIIRHDGEQDMTKFSSILPPGELGSLAGVSKCPDSAIALAKTKTGRQEEQSPSCPANSLIGHTLAGAGVGDSLTYVPGNLYLGGPYHGDPLSVISITPAVAGPFDAGTVVVQLALTLNPKTAEVEVDGAASDPIPHILKGIVLKVRDLRVYVDRKDFTLNPTSCEEEKVRGTMFGANLNVFDPADDDPVGLSTRYQAADCQSLGYQPKLDLNLIGGTKRGGHPSLKAIYTPRPGDANTEGLSVRLPRSAFLDQAHIKTICTRVQFAAGQGNGADCPKASQYGFVKAWTPLLEEPLEGPVFLRSSNHKLPDMVFALHGLVNVEVATRIDSSHGGIRATVEEAPDAPLSKVLLRMQGQKKGLIINSKNLCTSTNKANVLATGHNGKQSDSKPVMRAQCGKARHHKRKRHR